MSDLTDAELLAELEGAQAPAFKPELASTPVACARLTACMKCEFRQALSCTKIQPKGDEFMFLSSAVRRADTVCPEARWG